MRKVLLGCCLTAMVAVPVIAQGGSTPQQAPSTNRFAICLKGTFKSNADYLVKSAQGFPDDKYTAKLGTQRETRTFAALIGHVTKAKVPALD